MTVAEIIAGVLRLVRGAASVPDYPRNVREVVGAPWDGSGDGAVFGGRVNRCRYPLTADAVERVLGTAGVPYGTFDWADMRS